MDSVDRTALLEQDSWRISQKLSRQGTRFSFRLVSESPIEVNELAVVNLSDGATVLFEGLAYQTKTLIPGPNLWQYEVDAVDYTVYLDNRAVAGRYMGQTVGYIVADLLANYPCGITGNNVSDGPALALVSFQHVTFSRALTELCSMLSGPGTNWSWYVDSGRDLHLFDQATAEVGSAYLTDDPTDTGPNAAHYQRDTGGGATFARIIDSSMLRTRVIVRGGNLLSNLWTDSFVGNGQQMSWPVSYAPETSQYTPTLTVGGASASVAVDTGMPGQTAAFLLTVNAAGQWFLVANNPATPPGNGVVLALRYKFQAPVLVSASNQTAVSAYAKAWHDGRFDTPISDSSIQTLGAALQRAQAELAGYSVSEERLQVRTVESTTFTGTFQAGTLVTVTNTQLGIVQQPYLLLNNTIQGRPGGYRVYQMELVRVS
jgi:hypothetical protein